MCGITGKITANGAVEPALIERMCSVIVHRGPDSGGSFVEDGAGLGIRRLAIIDLDTGDQPVFSEDGNVVVVLNGEIYNYVELRAELEARGHRFATHSDTEVIVHLYEELGDRCVERLRGMFAFALWDRRRRRALLARDRIGKKPLFYARRGGTLWFGSEAKSILEDPQVPREVDVDAIDCYLHYQYVPDPLSAFAALRKLPPAHFLIWQDGALETRRYWSLDYESKLDISEPEMHELIREQLLEATRLRMRSDVPLGALLSGGVDSSAVVAAMVRLTGEPVKTFSIGFDVEEFDETRFARQVAEHLGTDHHEFRVEPEALEILPKLVWHYGEPFADSSAIPSFYLAELTRQHVTVALNGDGGDENFAGYARYWAHQVVARADRLPTPLARAGAEALRRMGTGPRENTRRARAQRLLDAVQMTPADRYAMWMAYFTERDRERLYTREFRAGLGAHRSAPDVIRGPWEASRASNLVDRLLDVDVRTYLAGDLLVKMDIATMAHSLEVRSPLLDQDFMQMVASLPPSAKVHKRVTKRVFKDALRPWLPDELLDRRKMGFCVPIREWFRGPLRDLPGDVLLDSGSVARGWFEPAEVRRLIREHQDGTRDHANRLWALVQLELWLRTYIDVPKPQLQAA